MENLQREFLVNPTQWWTSRSEYLTFMTEKIVMIIRSNDYYVNAFLEFLKKHPEFDK